MRSEGPMKRSDAINCLATGRSELSALLGHSTYHEDLTTTGLIQRWLAKVTAAGMGESDAKAFLAHRLGQEVG